MRYVTSLVVIAATFFGIVVTINAGTIVEQYQVTLSATVGSEEEPAEVTQTGGGASTVYLPPQKRLPFLCTKRADLNCDTYVDLTDFSILLYWMDQLSVPSYVDLNQDGRIDIYDFSIMAYHWNV